jgi:hypothetical protein
MKLEHVISVVNTLDRAGVRYLVVGGLAVNAHGLVRYTNDLDLVIGLQQANIRLGLDALASIGYRPRIPVTNEEFADAGLRARWRAEKGMVVLNLWNEARRETPIDVFVEEPFDFEAEHRSACRMPLAEGLEVPFVRLNTLLRMKQSAGRPQDLQDIIELRRIEELRHGA